MEQDFFAKKRHQRMARRTGLYFPFSRGHFLWRSKNLNILMLITSVRVKIQLNL